MLNLDLLGGISFEKGCYTGQEIIARTHYPRRDQATHVSLRSARARRPRRERASLAGDQHAGDVVDAAATQHGCELLAVISLAHANSDCAGARRRIQGVALQKLPLPSCRERRASARLTSRLRLDYVSGRMYGNSSTSRIDGEFVNSITSRSMPTPRPAVGGMPYSSART